MGKYAVRWKEHVNTHRCEKKRATCNRMCRPAIVDCTNSCTVSSSLLCSAKAELIQVVRWNSSDANAAKSISRTRSFSGVVSFLPLLQRNISTALSLVATSGGKGRAQHRQQDQREIEDVKPRRNRKRPIGLQKNVLSAIIINCLLCLSTVCECGVM
jgi:hypothetical protein